MRILVAGATGVIGKPLVQKLIDRGYAVVGMTRNREKAERIRSLGAEVVIANGLDRIETLGAVGTANPEVIIHQMTGLTGVKNYRNFDAEFGLTNRLRTEGTDNLLEAAKETGVTRLIAQSYAGWNYERTGTELKTEEDEFDFNSPANQRETLKALRHVETTVLGTDGIDGTVLRYGSFYGPGTGIALDGDIVEAVRGRKLPIIAGGTGIWSFIHVDDAASATVAAVDQQVNGIFNIVDDDPAPVSEWLPELARVIDAKPPMRVPLWVGKLAAGEVGVSMMTKIRGVSNAKAKRELRWEPKYKSWREGFRTGLRATETRREVGVGRD